MINNGIGRVPGQTNLPDFRISNARPEWSKPRRRGRSDVVRVQAKLKAGSINFKQQTQGIILDNDVPSGCLT